MAANFLLAAAGDWPVYPRWAANRGLLLRLVVASNAGDALRAGAPASGGASR